jgi:hypothetical protein
MLRLSTTETLRHCPEREDGARSQIARERESKKRGKREEKGPENLCTPGLSQRGDPVPCREEGRARDDGARQTRAMEGCCAVSLCQIWG